MIRGKSSSIRLSPDILHHLGNLFLVDFQDRLDWIPLDSIPDHAFAMNYVVHCYIRLVVMFTIGHVNVGWFFIFFDIIHSYSCLAGTLRTIEVTSYRRFHFSSIKPKKPVLEVMGFPAVILFYSKKSAKIVLNTCGIFWRTCLFHG